MICHDYHFSSLPGPPLTEKSSIMELLDHNVTVGLGIVENWAAHNTRFDLAWVSGFSKEKLPVATRLRVVVFRLGCHRSGRSSV